MRLILQKVSAVLLALWRWVRFSKHAGTLALLLACLGVLLGWFKGYHEAYMPPFPTSAELPKGWEPPPDGAYITLYMLAYLRLFILTGGVALHVFLIRAWPDVNRMLRPLWVGVGVLVFWTLVSQLYAHWEVMHSNYSGEVISHLTFVLKVLLLCALPVSAPVLLGYYGRCRIMEKYVLRSVLQPLFFCFLAFFALWVVMDLLDNLQDFQQAKIGRTEIIRYYLSMMPFIFVTVAPISLLLATVYVLGRMSRSNELISMLGAGQSLGQVLRPVFVVGVACAFLGTVANFELAPTSAGNEKKLLENVNERIRQDVSMLGLVYRNEEARRTWFIGIVPSEFRQGRMRRLEIRQEDEQGRLVKAWFARSAFWWPANSIWSLYSGVEVDYVDGQVNAIRRFNFDDTGYDRRDLDDWTETPWVLMSGSLTPDFLGVPTLVSYLSANADYETHRLAPFWAHLFYRFALPWQCLVVVMFAAPLAVVFSRRGLVGGIANAVLLFFVLMFFDNLFLNLAKSGRVPSFLAVWMPHLILGTLGWFLFRLRSQNRELPKLSLKGLSEAPSALWSLLRGSSPKPA